MAHVVAANVVSIITSFDYAADVLDQIRKKHSSKLTSASTTHQTLLKSLRQGPVDIEREYRRCLREAGQHFAAGDDRAVAALSRTLTRMNAGLVGTITSYLDVGKKQQCTMDVPALIKLSEVSRKNTLRTMSELSQRMVARFTRHSMTKVSAVPSQKKTRPHRQFEIRKNSSPKIAQVTIENSSKRAQLAMVKSANKKSVTSTPSSNLSKVRSASSSTTAVNSVKSPRLDPRGIKQDSKSSADFSKTSTKNSSSRSLPRYEDLPKPALQTKSPEQQLPTYSTTTFRPNIHGPPATTRIAPARRKFTPTLYSIATDSTKLGEIPLHKWAMPYDFDAMSILNKQALNNGWPLIDTNGNAMVKPRKKFGITGLFKRKSKETS